MIGRPMSNFPCRHHHRHRRVQRQRQRRRRRRRIRKPDICRLRRISYRHRSTIITTTNSFVICKKEKTLRVIPYTSRKMRIHSENPSTVIPKSLLISRVQFVKKLKILPALPEYHLEVRTSTDETSRWQKDLRIKMACFSRYS